MSVPRFFCPSGLGRRLVGSVIELPESVAHHAVRVVRLKSGDALTLFDGEGGEYAAVLTDIDKRAASARIERFLAVDRESPLAITLVQAIAANDAMDYAVRKAVELGAFAIEPVTTERSAPLPAGERAQRRVQHWSQIAIAAAEQCGRNRIPPVAHPRSLADWAARWESPAFACLPTGGKSIRDLSAPEQGRCAIVVGPEGGLSEREVALLEARGVVPIALGPRVLRTETAAVAVLAVLQSLWGDL